MLRNKAKLCLSLVIDNKQEINTIELVIFNNSKNDTEYTQYIYQYYSNLLYNIKQDNTGFDILLFEDLKKEEQEQDDFLNNPFEVSEGVIECKCGSKRVFSYQKQTRSIDEPITTFMTCICCKKNWTM